MARLVLVAYPPDDPLGTPAGTLTSAYDTSVTVEDDGIGAGSFALHPDDPEAAWCVQDAYVAAWRDTVAGDPLAGFWIDALTEVVLSPDEGGGRELRVAGQGPIAILDEALVWPRAVNGGDAVVQRSKGRWRWKEAHPARVLMRLLEEASERGCLPGVTWDFSRDADSDGAAWSDDAARRFTVPIGSSLLDVVRELRETGLSVAMTPGLVLRAWESSGRDLSGSVTFTAGVDIRETAESTAAARRGRSHVVVEGEDADEALRYRVVHDPDIAAALGRRKEGFFRYTRTATPALLERVGRRKLRRWQRLFHGPFVLPVIDTPGQVALVDYTAGDTVTVPTAFAASGSERIAAISLTEGEDGSYEVTLEFGDVAPDASSGRSLGGDTSGQDCCGGAGGAGDRPGAGGGSGGGTTVVDTADTAPLLLTDFACEGTGDLVVHATAAGVSHLYSEGDTTAAIALPAGWDDVPGRYLLVLVHEAADSNVRAEMEAVGFTKGIAPVGSDLFFRRLDGTETWLGDEVTLFFSGESVELAAVTLLVSGIYEELPDNPGLWYVASSSLTADPDDVPAPSWAGEPAIAITTCRTDGAAITAGPSGYTEAGTDDGTAIGLRVDYRLMDAAAEDPASYAASGVEQTYTYLVRGGGCDPWRLALQDDTAAWWPGGNAWDVAPDFYGSTIAIVDGVLTITQGPTYASRQLAVRGTSHGEAALPMEVDDWEIEARYRRGGQEAPLVGDQSFAFTWAGAYLGGILFDHPGYGPCVRVLGDGMETSTKTLTPLGAWGRIKFRCLDGVLSAKEWAEAADEPGWEVSTAASDLEEPDDVFRLLTNFGAASGTPMTLEVDWIRVHPIVSSGATVSRVLAHGDGSGPFALGEPFTPGTLRVTVDDRPVTPVTQSASAGTFALAAPVYHDPAGHPAGCAVLRVTYEVA